MEQLEMRYEGGLIIAPAPPDGLIVRNYRPTDFRQMIDALVPLTGKRYDAEDLDKVILSHVGVIPERVFVAELFGKIVGTATGWVHDDGGTLHMVSALREVSGLGVGCAVCAAAVNRLIEDGCAYVDLTTDDFRLAAIVIYVRLGFRPVIRTSEMLSRWEKICAELGFKNVIAEAYR